ncbi:hypothetical protein [Hansschlegelia plantiphila]|uniref:Uncharacterized protein n=1 Tax=Hansschlegelia plantiphila TaxID=374655 RepID=A0A9W6IX94_9HYPH|nr:hypothetical protein [Hansschlegelia plantiphila]GLK66397.1 hypothetical protein GCM10008179_00350 [Hansschlegelia plantiphila]
MIEALALSASAAALAAAVALFRRSARAERAARRDVLADCAALLDGGALTVDQAGYGVLRGRFAGREVALRPFAEQLAFRRLPQLWLVTTVRTPIETAASIDVLRRPTGTEFYSPGEGLPERVAPPASWPQDARVRGSAGCAALLARLEAPLAATLADPRIKDVFVAPGGVRVVSQLRQGERGSYLIFRDSVFAGARATPDEAARALGLALELSTAAGAIPERRDAIAA